MGKKDDKLREALGKLFKSRGESIETTKQSKSAKAANRERKQANGVGKDNGKQTKGSTKPEPQQENKIKIQQENIKDNKRIKKTTKNKSTHKINGEGHTGNIKKKIHADKTGAHGQALKPTLQKNKQKTNNLNKADKKTSKKSDNVESGMPEVAKYPRGYFVMNHGKSQAAEGNAKKNKSNKQKTTMAAEHENENSKAMKKNKKIDNKEAKLPKKRKAKQDNGPLKKMVKKQNGQMDSNELLNEQTSDVASADEITELSTFNFGDDEDSDESSNASFMDETDTTEESYSDSSDEETLSDEYEDEYSFESDDLDDTYSEQLESEEYFSDSEASFTDSEVSFTDSESLNSIHDPDYELPKTVLEDHIVHKGLAVKYDISTELEIKFDEHNDSAQVIELPSTVANIEQHESLNPEHLRTLELNFVEQVTVSSTVTPAVKDTTETDDCPELVPIDDVNFRLWTSGIEMDDEIFSEHSDDEFDDSDEESITAAEGNINDKYLKNNETSASEDDDDDDDADESDESLASYDEDGNVVFKAPKPPKGLNIKADVILAKQGDCEAFNFKNNDTDEEEELSLSEIIARTLAYDDDSNVVVKTAIVNDVLLQTNALQNEMLEAAEEMRCSEQQMLTPNEDVVLDLSNNAALLRESVHSPLTIDDLIVVASDESTASTPDQLETTATSFPQQKFKSLFFDAIDSHQVLVLLKSAFYIYGTVKATLIAGAAEIFGYKLEKWDTHQLYSPRGVCALQVSPCTSSLNALESPLNSKEDILTTIGTFCHECEFHVQDLEELVKSFEPRTDAILLLARNDDAGNVKRMLQQHVKENIFPAQIPQSRPFYTSEFLLDCMINVQTEYPLHIPPQWYKLRLESNSKFLLVGGKAVGKSTLLRFLVNQHLNRFPAVLIIDLDIGQPEIFASQAVSCALIQQPLLGPGFFYNLQPDKAFCVAHSNVVLCAHRYMPAVLELLQYCQEQPRYRNIPWIVNTMGYNKGFGAELIAVLSDHLRPTHIVQLQSNVPINNFDYFFEPHVMPTIERNVFYSSEYASTNTAPLKHHLHVLPTAVLQKGRYQREWQMSAKDLRYVMLLTQLSRILNEHSQILNQQHTYCINIDDVKITNPLSQRATALEVAKSLVSNLVYLGRTELSCTQLDTIECLGIGIVRAIDWPARQLYLLTALPAARLRKVNTLTAGDMPLPASMLTLQNLSTNVDVPFVQNVADEATSRAIRQFYSRT